jgi:hypothetical protein
MYGVSNPHDASCSHTYHTFLSRLDRSKTRAELAEAKALFLWNRCAWRSPWQWRSVDWASRQKLFLGAVRKRRKAIDSNFKQQLHGMNEGTAKQQRDHRDHGPSLCIIAQGVQKVPLEFLAYCAKKNSQSFGAIYCLTCLVYSTGFAGLAGFAHWDLVPRIAVSDIFILAHDHCPLAIPSKGWNLAL